MSIRKKDRSFEDMLREIHVEEVPVEYIDLENHLIGLKGALPGANKSLIFIQAK